MQLYDISPFEIFMACSGHKYKTTNSQINFGQIHDIMISSEKNTLLSLIEAPGAQTTAQEEGILDLENQAQLQQTVALKVRGCFYYSVLGFIVFTLVQMSIDRGL